MRYLAMVVMLAVGGCDGRALDTPLPAVESTDMTTTDKADGDILECGEEGQRCCRERAIVRAGHECNPGLHCVLISEVTQQDFCTSDS